jgi:hypothetical protein
MSSANAATGSGLLGRADERQVAVALEQVEVGVDVVIGGHQSRMKSNVPACAAICAASLETTTSCAPSLRASSALPGRRREQHDVRAEGLGKLHAHVAEAAQADDADLLAGADLPVRSGE